ncbi:hypothetical protein WA026_004911 [Henosepilachna vigintioctopunctata]|uniref:Uncharacterized protein n=1 Tax=Henosepilachna vigintioctopunctata TaxID=420089 RepID=A0AAW1UK32_9CUCU
MMSKLYVIVFLLILHKSYGSPFLHNIATFLTSASGSSSLPEKTENIADLRKFRDSYFEKQQVSPRAHDNEFSFDEDPQTNNGVVPTIIQKKVTKLLRKLAFITMFVNSGSNPSTTDEDFNSGKDELDTEFDKEFGVNNSTGLASNVTTNDNSTSLLDKDEISPNEIVLFDENGRVEKVPKNKNQLKLSKDIKSQKQQEPTNKIAGFLRFSPNDIGLFFLEALATFVGLAYGIVSQSNITLPSFEKNF